MSQLFDLNVQNYSLRELLDFFGLTTNDDAETVTRKCSVLKQKIAKDPKLGPMTKGKMHDFLNSATSRLSQSRNATTELFANAAWGDKGRDNNREMTAAMTAAMKAAAPAPPPTQFMELKNDVDSAFLIQRPSEQLGLAENFKNGNSVLRGAPPGIVNPMATSTIKRAVNVDTRFRTNYYYTKSTDFVMNLPVRFENVTSMSVASYELPLTYYAVSQQYQNNCIVFQWESSATLPPFGPDYNGVYTLVIPDGNYRTRGQSGGGSTIEDTINGILAGTDLVAVTGIAFTVDPTSGRSIFACNSALDASGNPVLLTPYTGAMRIVFNVKSNSELMASSATSNSSFQNDARALVYYLGWQMGFRTAVYEMRGGVDASGNLIVPQAAVSEGICLITGPQYVFLCIDDYNHNVNNYYAVAYGASTIAPNIIARLNIKQQINSVGAYGITGGESLSTSLTYSREYFGPVNVERIRITLIDDLGRVLDLNNMDWSFALMFECVYNSSSA
jgi:hypothetical protein